MSIKKRVLDVGNCGPDHRAIAAMLSRRLESVEVVQSHGPHDTMALLRASSFDLVMINRKLDHDYSDGVEILKLIKSNPDTESIPVMLITNYAEHQQQAIELGAIRGFGKLELDATATGEHITKILCAPC